MYLSLNWIKKYVTLPAVKPEQLALDLTMSTVEVEAVIEQAKSLDNIVIGQIKEVVKHPQADRLWICKTDIGDQVLQIVCGGSNLKEGMLVIVAKVGSQVVWHGEGEPVTLEKTKIRGQESNGMIVGANEVGLINLFPPKDDHEIIDVTDYNFKVGVPAAEALGLDDVILEIDNKSMTHRPDLWGQYGLAREVAAIYEKKLKPLPVKEIPKATGDKKLSVKIKTDLCNRYSGIVMDNIQVGPSPWWLKLALESVGLRSINNIVDVTNYIMMDMGQPMHAFDYKLLDGETITVTETKKETKFQALDGEEYTLPENTVMISDSSKDVAIGGIKGGLNSEIKNNTQTIVLESANFNASAIRKSSTKAGLRTDASARHEKALDPEMTVDALARAVQLILEVSPGSTIASKLVDVKNYEQKETSISLDQSLVTRMLGVEIEDSTITAILKRLSFEVKKRKDGFDVKVPSFRATKDITIPEDLVEEIARVYGYDNIKPELPAVTLEQPVLSLEKKIEDELKDRLVNNSQYVEVQNYSFANNFWTKELKLEKERLEVGNVLTDEQRYMRTSLLPALMQNVEDNLRWKDDFNLFELGRIFKDTKGIYTIDNNDKEYLPDQPYYLAGVSVSKTKSNQDIYLEVKGFLEELFVKYGIEYSFESQELNFTSKRLIVKAHDQKFASFGLLHPDVRDKHFKGVSLVWWELNVGKFIKHADLGRTFSALPKYPAIIRDLSLVFDSSISWEAISSEIQGVSGLIQEVELFDIFHAKELGENKRSLAFSMTFRSSEKTLESKEVDRIVNKILLKLEDKFKAQPR